MTKFIKVTEISKMNGLVNVILNATDIKRIEKSHTSRDTNIKFKDGSFIFASESVDSIWEQINGK